jgi:hypothetical protein
MLEIARAAMRFPWTITVFGAQEVLGSIMPRSDAKGGVNADLYHVAATARREFNGIAPLFAGYQFVDSAQRAAVDAAADILTLRAFNPHYLMNLGSEITKVSSDAFRSVGTFTALRNTARRIRNNFTVVGLVNQVNAPDHLSPNGDYPLEEVIADCYSHGGYSALWSVEGAGERYAHAWLRARLPLEDMFRIREGARLPTRSLLMMHAGAGIAFAKEALSELTPYSSEYHLDDSLRAFLRMCREAALPGYEGPVLESLGLVTRTWNAELLVTLSRRLALIDSGALEYFWHGAGRSMYFSPVTMLPGFSPWFAADKEPRDESSRRNALAGAAWAFTAVNRQQPEIIANFIATREDEIEGTDTFSNGMMSAMIMASAMCPEDPSVPALINYRPSDTKTAAAWDRHIGPDFPLKFSQIRKVLEKHNQLGGVFRYQPLAGFAIELERPMIPATER